MGSFSIDRFSAARKLSRTQFPSPYHYAVKLVQWAVASRATRVKVTVWARSLQVEHDGQPVGEHLPELVRFALASPTGPDRRLVHLASAILAVQALNPGRVQVWSQGQVLRVFGDQDKLDKTSSKSERIKISGLKMGGGRGMFFSWLGLIAVMRPEVELLHNHCAYSDIPVYLNGVPLSRSFLGIRQYTPRVVEGRTRLYIPSGASSMPLRVALAPAGNEAAICVPGPEMAGVFVQGRWWLRPQPNAFRPLNDLRRPASPPAEAVAMPHLYLADFPMYRGWAFLLDYTGNFEHRLTAGFRSNTLKLVQDGVLIEVVQPLLSDKKMFAEGIVATDSLPLDLSHFRYVRGPELTALIQEVGLFLQVGR